jgi:hypothetical protein
VNDTVAPGIAVLRTRLPYVDRRSLSEAWFSALHLASGEAPAGVRRTQRPPSSDALGSRFARLPATPAESASARPATAFARRYAATLRPSSAGGDALLRSIDAPDALPAVRRATIRARSYPARQTALTVGVDGSRVQLLLRRDGNVLHVIALCRSDVAPLVGRALARADAHLRVRGNAVRASLRAYDAEVRA